MNPEAQKSQVEVQELFQLARKVTLEKNYEQAIRTYKQAITILLNAARESNTPQKNELIKTITKNILEEVKKVEELRKSNGKEQLGQEEDDPIKYFENEDTILADLENAFKTDNSGPTKKEEEEETKLEDESKFQRYYYPNANECLISLIQGIEKQIIEPDTNICLDDITSIADSKKLAMKESIFFPLVYPQLFTGVRFFSNLVLIAGPHTEKMKIIHALAHESKARLLVLSISDLMSDWPHQGEKIFKIIFQICSYHAPLIIYLEDLEAFGDNRDPGGEDERIRRMKTDFLVQIQGLGSYCFEAVNPETKVKEYKPFIVIGTSDYPLVLDRAVRRRFERRLFLNLLNKNERRKFFQTYLEQSNAKIGEDVNWEYIVKHTEYYSPDDIASVCREAIMASKRIKVKEVAHSDKEIKELNKNKPEESIVTHKDFTEALRRIRRSILDSELEFYQGNIG